MMEGVVASLASNHEQAWWKKISSPMLLVDRTGREEKMITFPTPLPNHFTYVIIIIMVESILSEMDIEQY